MTNQGSAAVPSNKWSRLARLGRLAGGVVGGMVAEGARQVSRGRRPAISDLLLTPANARRLADQLAHLRGAAMKVGQLLSMDAGEVLAPEIADMLSRLRADAQPMPMSQLVPLLEEAWGHGWEHRFKRFSFAPLAAASIGQVHEAVTADGRRLALKIQYPGIRQSIDSDVDNVALLLRVSRLLPQDADLAGLLTEAKTQLHREADYLEEARLLIRFHELLGDTQDFKLPAVDQTLACNNILAMEYVSGAPIETLANAHAKVRDRAVSLLLELFFRELFEFRLIQTDPNFANFLYDDESRRLILLDFGATRSYGSEMTSAYRDLLAAAVGGDRPSMTESARRIGYFKDEVDGARVEAVNDIFLAATEPARCAGDYDFGTSDLALRVRDAAWRLGSQNGHWHTPPADALFLHRKLGGLYLLASRLKARVNVRDIIMPWLATEPTPVN